LGRLGSERSASSSTATIPWAAGTNQRLPAAAIDLCHCPGREIPGLIAGGDDPQGMVLTRAKLRDIVAVKNERLGEVLESLERAGRLSRTAAGWQQLE
jgi:hypothetical protein